MENKVVTIKFYPDKYRSGYSLTQGKIGIATTYPPGGQIQATVTISAETITARFES